MSLYIRNEKADRLARELVERTGETITEAVTTALEERLERTPKKPQTWDETWAFIQELQRRSKQHPVLDPRSPEELLYDHDGLPK